MISEMKKGIYLIVILFFICVPFGIELQAQNISKEVQLKIGAYLTLTVQKKTYVDKVRIDSIIEDKRNLRIYANATLSYMLFREDDVKNIYAGIKSLLPQEYKGYKLELYTDSYKIDDYVPYGRKEQPVSEVDKPLLTKMSTPVKISKGLNGKHIALWQSHGWYYEQKLTRWEWQRARLFHTVEDLYTQSYVLSYLVPMLENAGANVLLPRERDVQHHEIIIDEDKSTGSSIFRKTVGKEDWTKGSGVGFANLKEFYLDGENPFKAGDFLQGKTIAKGKESLCEWIPDIPEKGQYAVYVSYQSLANSADDALYTVYHQGGTTQFKINQTMGGGTWIYLGSFTFATGVNENCKVILTNKSDKSGRIVTADAVKIGGGMGNIARLPHESGIVSENVKSSDTLVTDKLAKLPKINFVPETSGYPRYTEAARYWLQWAGAPDSVYNKSGSTNDYTDDYQSRGFWVNYIAGGSPVLPNREGLNIPIDLAMAFHTDAGTTPNDSIIGTLGICMTHTNDGKFENGKSRLASRYLADQIMDEIVKDIRRDFDPDWTLRPLWNKSYAEARIPDVPTMLLELLSHQNFADMRYGLDPRFQFTVSRSVYKGMLKFISNQYGYDYVVQPLPVSHFTTKFVDTDQVELQWQPTDDISEPTAKAKEYIVYTRIGDQDFDNGIKVSGTSVKMNIRKDQIYSYKVTAANEGGESFPSEILSVCRNSKELGTVLIVNGFYRLSAPFSFDTDDSIAGFVDLVDHGVPYKNQYNYTGSQYEFRRNIPWIDDDAPGFGASNADFETSIVAGNTFDYPFVHGSAIANSGYSFVSCSNMSVMDDLIDLKDYKLVDLILGKQRQTKIGRGVHESQFKTFPQSLQARITEYCNQGGNIFISGSFVATDLWESEQPLVDDQKFATDVLKYQWRVGQAAVKGHVKSVASPYPALSGNYSYYNKLNPISYAVEAPDALEPVGESSFTIFRYSENNLSAGVASAGIYKTCVLGFPFESVMDEKERNKLMGNILFFMFYKETIK